MGRPVLDSDVAASVDAVLGEIRATARSFGCAAASADLGYLVTPGRLLALFAEAVDGLTVTQGTPDAWLDYRHRYAARYPALHLAAKGTAARVTLPLLQPLDAGSPAHGALSARVEKAATIHVNGIPVALAPGSDPQRVVFDATGATLDPLELEVAAGDEVWLYLLEQDVPAGTDPTFSVMPGTYTIDGVTVNTDAGGAFPAVSYPAADGFPSTGGPPLDGLLAPTGLAAGARLVAYLEAWERHVTAVEDPGIREGALGATDTTTRTALLGQVKLATLSGTLPGGDAAAPVLRAAFADVESSGGRVTVSVPDTSPTTDPCALPELAGYSGSDNRLYRIEAHQGGGLSQVLFKWSRDNGADLFAPTSIDSAGNLVFDAGTPLAAGDIVEVLSSVVDLGDDVLASAGAGGFVPSERAVGQLAQLRDVQVASSSDEVVFSLVELDDVTQPVTRDDRYGTLDDAVLKLRRWTGVLTPAGDVGPHTLEDGITVELSSTGTFRPGQFWQYEARAVGANANGPWREEPHGPERRFAPLALLQYDGASQPLRLLAWLDERFSHPCELDADGVDFAGERVGSASDTVQEALEELFERPDKSGSCSVTIGPGDDLAAAVASLPADGGELCFQAGLYSLPAPLTIANRKRVVVHGAGPSTILRATASEAALIFDGCSEIFVRTMRVEGGLAETAAGREHLNGALSFVGGGEVSVADCSLVCPDAQPGAKGHVRSGQTCLTARGGPQPLRVRVERNDVQVGTMQAGILLVDPEHAFVAGNVVRVAGARDLPTGRVADEGIVVAGAAVGTVELVDNLVEQTIQGIHVAASGPAAGRESADAVLLSRNVVHSRVPAAHPRARHAVFVGNAHSVHVKDTIATLERTGSGTPNDVDAIRLHGVFGPFVDVSQTSVRNFTRGVHVEPLDPIPSPRMWLVSETMAAAGFLGADAPDTVEQERNYPLHQVVASLSLAPAATTRNAATQHTITATARDAAGLPVKGVGVYFSVSGANHQAATRVVTDANGIASFSYAGANVGHDTISAFADSNGNGKQDANEPSTLASVDFISAAPASIALSSPSGTSPRGGVVTVTATVLTSGNAPVPDARVVFSVTGANGVAAKPVTTNSAGQAVFTYTGGNAGTDTINAFVDLNANNTREANEPQATALQHTVQIVAGTIQLLPANSVVNEGARPVFNATVRDPSGSPVAGVVVRFSVAGVNAATASAQTDANGVAGFQYPAAAKVGSDVITAYADVNNNSTRDANEPQTQTTLSVLHVQPATTVVPDIVGMLQAGATSALQAAKLKLGTVTSLADPPRPSSGGGGPLHPILHGPYVFTQSPAAGAAVAVQSSVNVKMRKEWDAADANPNL